MDASPLLAVLGSFLFWLDIYLLLHVLRRRWTAEWTCRVVTTTHATIVTALCLLSTLELGNLPFYYIGKASTRLHLVIVFLSIGYFTFDFAWCVRMRTEGPVMLLHHAVSIFGFSYVLYTGRYGCEIITVLAGSEVTNPLLQLRWFLKELGRYSGALEKVVDWTFVFLFCSIRMGAGTVFWYFFFFSPEVDVIARCGGTVFYVISVIFGVQILSYMHYKYFKKNCSTT